MSKWKIHKLGELVEVKGGKRLPKGHDYATTMTKHPYLRVLDFEKGSISMNNLKYITDDTAEKIKRYIISSEDVYISIAGTIGVVGIVPQRCDGANLTENAAKLVIKDKEILNKFYLASYLRSPIGQSKIQEQIIGTTQPKLALFRIESIEIPLPPSDVQKHIADILDKTQEIIDGHKKQLEELDNLIKATFYDMFGDPVKNPKGWEMTTVESACTDIVDCPHSTPVHSNIITNYPSIRTTEIRNGYIDWDSMKYVNEEEFAKRTKRIIPQACDIIYAREGSYGDAVILPEGYSFCLGQRVMLLRVDKIKYHHKYFWYLLRSEFVYNQANKRNVGATVGHVNVGDIKKFIIPIPPLEIQNKFAEIVSNIEEQKSLVKQAIIESQNLFNSLMSKYFD